MGHPWHRVRAESWPCSSPNSGNWPDLQPNGAHATWPRRYLVRQEHRPKLLHIGPNDGCKPFAPLADIGPCSRDILVENLRMVQSPYWTFYAEYMVGLEVRLPPTSFGGW